MTREPTRDLTEPLAAAWDACLAAPHDASPWDTLLRLAADAPQAQRDALAHAVCTAAFDSGALLELPRTPADVLDRLVVPFVVAGARADSMPETRWLFQVFRGAFAAVGRQLQLDGIVTGDGRHLLESAVRLAPDDGASWRLLARCHVDLLDFAQHHLDVGDELELDEDVCRASLAVLDTVAERGHHLPPALRRQCDELRALFADWFGWRDGHADDADRPSFAAWCRAHDRSWWFLAGPEGTSA